MKGLPFMLAKDKIRASAKTDSTASCCCVADLEIALIAKLCPDTLSCAKKTLPFCFGFCSFMFFFLLLGGMKDVIKQRHIRSLVSARGGKMSSTTVDRRCDVFFSYMKYKRKRLKHRSYRSSLFPRRS